MAEGLDAVVVFNRPASIDIAKLHFTPGTIFVLIDESYMLLSVKRSSSGS